MKMNKDKFLKTELGASMTECVKAWDAALEQKKKYNYMTEEYKMEEKAALRCQAQWEVFKMAVKQFYGIEYFFTRTDEYFGICTNNGELFLYKEERKAE